MSDRRRRSIECVAYRWSSPGMIYVKLGYLQKNVYVLYIVALKNNYFRCI